MGKLCSCIEAERRWRAVAVVTPINHDVTGTAAATAAGTARNLYYRDIEHTHLLITIFNELFFYTDNRKFVNESI